MPSKQSAASLRRQGHYPRAIMIIAPPNPTKSVSFNGRSVKFHKILVPALKLLVLDPFSYS